MGSTPDQPPRERTTDDKITHLALELAALADRVKRLEAEVLPQEPDPEIGLP